MKFTCAIIGYGYMGEIRHKIIKKIFNLNIKYIVDLDISLIPKDKNYKILSDYKNIDFKSVDIFFICTPNNISPKIVKKALSFKKYVFCEKPPAKNLKEILDLKKFKNSNKNLMFGFNHRFHPSVEKAKKIIDSNIFGNLICIRGVYGKSGDKNFKDSWRNNKKISGGGILLDQGIHLLDIYRYFCGNFDKIKCFKTNKFWKFKVEDNAFLILKNKNNQIASLHSSSSLPKYTFNIEATFEKGFFVIEGLLSKSGRYGKEKIIFAKRKFDNKSQVSIFSSKKVIKYSMDNSWRNEIKLFLNYITQKSKIKINNIHDAYQVMKIIDLAYREN